MQMMKPKLAALAVAVGLAIPLAGAAEDAPGSFKIAATNTTLKFYGYVQLDTTYDITGRVSDIEDFDWATILAAQPLDDSPTRLHHPTRLYMTMRTSRVGFTTTTPSGVGDIGTKLEADFNGPNPFQPETFTNSYLFRVRHAYGTVGSWLLIGQTWSTFLDLPSYADTVDFNGPGSIALIRQPQIRVTLPVAKNTNFIVAAEAGSNNGGFSANQSGLGTFTASDVTIPDFHAKLETSGSWGSASLAGVALQYRGTTFNHGTGRVGTGQTGSAPLEGWGVGASGSFKILGDTLVIHAEGGTGIGRYLFNTVNGNNQFGAHLDSTGNLAVWQAFAYHIGYTHVWNPQWRSNLVWSQTFLGQNGITPSPADFTSDPDGANADNKRLEQAFVNTFWTVTKNMELGLEYAWGRRVAFTAVPGVYDYGRENRVNFTAHYNFY